MQDVSLGERCPVSLDAQDSLKVHLMRAREDGHELTEVEETQRDLWVRPTDIPEKAVAQARAEHEPIVKQFINPGVGQLRLRELNVPAFDRLLRVIVERNGATTAKGARSVMSGMVGMAMRHGAMTTNPTRDVAPISVKKKMVKVLTPAETELLVKKLRTNKEAKRRLVAAHEATARTIRETLALAEGAPDQVSTHLLVRRLDAHEKTAWMLRSMLA